MGCGCKKRKKPGQVKTSKPKNNSSQPLKRPKAIKHHRK